MKLLVPTLTLLLALSLISTTCTKKNPTPSVVVTDTLPDIGLKNLNSKILIGAAVEIDKNSDKYRSIVKKELSACQSLWYPAWGGWLGVNVYDFKDFSDNVNWLKANNISPMMHMLIGPDNYMPDWLKNRTWQAVELDSLMKNMIYRIMDTNDNKIKVDVWNVANELFEDDGTYRQNMVWLKMGMENDNSKLAGDEKINAQHPVFVRKAFQYCRQKTNAKLELRDFRIENDQPNNSNYRQSKALYQLVKHMLNEKIPIDAIGIQGHLSIGKAGWALDNNNLRETIKKYKSLGVEVYITELDIRTDERKWTPALAELQKQDYNNYIKQAIEGGVSRINFWGIYDDSDLYWLLGEYPLLWDKNLEKKLAYWGVKAALETAK
jgi:GH35 family endo-1,4-beta-xylanase